MDKKVVICKHTHTHNDIIRPRERRKSCVFATTWMNPEGIMLSEISQTGVWGNWGEVGKMVQTHSGEMNEV